MKKKTVLLTMTRNYMAAAGSTVGSIVRGHVTKSSGGHGVCLAPRQMVLQDFS